MTSISLWNRNSKLDEYLGLRDGLRIKEEHTQICEGALLCAKEKAPSACLDKAFVRHPTPFPKEGRWFKLFLVDKAGFYFFASNSQRSSTSNILNVYRSALNCRDVSYCYASDIFYGCVLPIFNLLF